MRTIDADHRIHLRAKSGANAVDALTEYDFAHGREATIACAIGLLDGVLDWLEQATGSRKMYEDLQQRADLIASEMTKVMPTIPRRET